MRAVFMGTPDFASKTLEKMIEEKYEITGVVTQPDKPKGRGKSLAVSPVKEVALANGLPVYQPKRVRDEEFIKLMKELKPEVIVVVAFGQIIPQDILDIPQYGCVNVHASLLPKYRGAAPIQWAIINGEKETGITTMRMDAGLDTGDIILKRIVPIDEKETMETLFNKLSAEGASLLIETLRKLEDGTAEFEKQGDAQSEYARMIDKKMGKIDWNQDAVSIERLIRGLNPWPSAYTSYKGKTLKIWAADVQGESSGPNEPGTVVKISKNEMWVQTAEGSLAIKELQLEGKKRMAVDAFMRGYSVQEGEILQ